MTDYVKSTNFTSKDSLAVGNPLKIIKGAEFDVEFNAIATAVATKADLASPALTGTPTAPTAALGTNTNQIATTAFVQASVYPIGSLYLNATTSTNPATLLGFGTWVAFGAGRMLVGFNATDPLFDTAEETGGSKDATLVSHTHTATVTDPGHTHNLQTYTGGAGRIPGRADAYDNASENGQATTFSSTTGISVSNSTEGSSATNANLPPYITVYMWKRTA